MCRRRLARRESMTGDGRESPQGLVLEGPPKPCEAVQLLHRNAQGTLKAFQLQKHRGWGARSLDTVHCCYPGRSWGQSRGRYSGDGTQCQMLQVLRSQDPWDTGPQWEQTGRGLFSSQTGWKEGLVPQEELCGGAGG